MITVPLALAGLILVNLTVTAQPVAPRTPACSAVAAPIIPSESPDAHPVQSAAAGSMVLQMVTDVPLPGGASRFDYQSLDPTTGRLYIAHMGAGQLVVVDTKTRAVVGTVADLPTVTGVLAVPELGRVYAAVAGDQQVAVIDARSLAVVARLGQIGFPDGLDYAPAAGKVFVSDETGGGELVIDTASNRVLTTIDIGGEAGNTHFDPGSGCVLVAVQTADRLVAIDPSNDRIVGRYDLDADCNGPHGFFVDAPARLAFVTCEDNATLLVVDLSTMRATTTFPVGNGPDVLAFDPGLRRLYVASESGTVSIFDERGGTLQSVGEVIIPHAHSIAIDPATHLVYLPLENVDGMPVLRIMAPTLPTVG